jgi:hypothetical protein
VIINGKRALEDKSFCAVDTNDVRFFKPRHIKCSWFHRGDTSGNWDAGCLGNFLFDPDDHGISLSDIKGFGQSVDKSGRWYNLFDF